MQVEENVLDDKDKQIKPRKHNTILVVLYRIACVLLILICLCFIAFNIVFDHNNISGESMQPTYNYPNVKDEDVAYYSSYFNYTRGDIIVAKKVGYNIIKRLIAVEGDKFEIKKLEDGYYHIFVNDIMQDESYLLTLEDNEFLFYTIITNCSTEWPNKPEVTINSDSLSFIVPQNYCFYLGDNRLNSADCADYGPVLKENILYKVVFVIPHDCSFIGYWWKKIFN